MYINRSRTLRLVDFRSRILDCMDFQVHKLNFLEMFDKGKKEDTINKKLKWIYSLEEFPRHPHYLGHIVLPYFA